MDDITIIIKTFNRKYRLYKLLDSIKKYYDNAKIIIVDDSKRPYRKCVLRKYKDLKINYINAEYDIGLSAGRNILINNVTTKYFVLCDDDFVFDERTKIDLAKKYIEKYRLDLLGGVVYNRMSFNSLYSFVWAIKKPSRIAKIIKSDEFISIYNGKYEDSDNNIKLYIDNKIEHFNNKHYYSTDICSNFFIAKTESIKKIGGWQPELLKVGEHELFFYRAKKNKMKIGFTPDYGVRHYPKKTISYLSHRERQRTYFRMACKLLKIHNFTVYDGDRILMSYNQKTGSD